MQGYLFLQFLGLSLRDASFPPTTWDLFPILMFDVRLSKKQIKTVIYVLEFIE